MSAEDGERLCFNLRCGMQRQSHRGACGYRVSTQLQSHHFSLFTYAANISAEKRKPWLHFSCTVPRVVSLLKPGRHLKLSSPSDVPDVRPNKVR